MDALGSRSPAPQEVDRFRDLVARRLGLAFEEAKRVFLGDVLRRRLEACSEDAQTYLARLERFAATEETGSLARELTVPETYFFRNIDQFHALAQAVLPERLRRQHASRSLRILSAGCASGEEAFSLAITVHESLPDASWNVSLRAVDLNPAVLERAARGRFTTWALRDTSEELQRRWFRQEGRELVLDETVRDAVRFEQRNLALDDADLWQRELYDVVFCRNVIMYFTPENALALIARITRSLAPGGYLFLGHAETLRGLSQEFHLRHTHGTFYYQRKDGVELAPGRVPDGDGVPRALGRSLSTFVEETTSFVDAIQRATDRIHELTRSPGAVAPAVPPPRPRPDLASALDLLGRERFSDALDAVRELPSESASDPDVLMLEAVLLAHGGQIERARDACHRLLTIDELSAGAHYVLALCREADGDRGAAADHDQVAAYLDPSFAMPRLHLGLMARRTGDRDAACRELGQALLLLHREDASRVLLFGGGFGRDALIALCTSEIESCGAQP